LAFSETVKIPRFSEKSANPKFNLKIPRSSGRKSQALKALTNSMNIFSIFAQQPIKLREHPDTAPVAISVL